MNTGAQDGVIGKISLLIDGPKNEAPYLLAATYYNYKNNKNSESEPFVLPGHSSINGDIVFTELEEVLNGSRVIFYLNMIQRKSKQKSS